MATFQTIENAITVLQQQRALLEDDVADLSLAALQEKLVDLRSQTNGEQYAQVTVLVADLSGFTKMSERRDAEEVRDTMNEVWQKLDGVVTSWGGKIDKHVGDAVIALFGIPKVHVDDHERAVQAALDMQMELALFNERARHDPTQYSWSTPRAQLRMRIGIHNGPLVIGQMGASAERTAVGDTLTIANHLEKNAPVEGILISEDLYAYVQEIFEVESIDHIPLNGKGETIPGFVVKREKARPFYMSIRDIQGVEPRIIGRNKELELLQDVLQMAIDSSMPKLITVLGDAGVGKSRLLYEFEQLVALLPDTLNFLRGRVHRTMTQTPYGLFRDLLSNYFDIHRRNSPAVAREKLVRGVVEVMAEDPAQARERAHLIGHLLGFDFSNSPYLQGIHDDAQQLREDAFREMVALFKAIATQHAAAILLLEDMHWADEGSFDLLDYLVAACEDVPMMMVCLARPSLLQKRPSWEMVEALNEKTYHRLMLPKLSAIDSRHLAMNILQHVHQLPLRLLELIVNRASGNPFQIEELIAMLIEFEVIVPQENRWQVQMINMPEIGVIPALSHLVRLRMDKLPSLEQVILHKAAVLGPIFWDTLLVDLVRKDDKAISHEHILETLYYLEQKGWIYRRKLSTFIDVQEYSFRHDSLSDAIYDTIEEEESARIHNMVAEWFVQRNGQYALKHAAVIAFHFQKAGDVVQAADWYKKAANYAENAYMRETAGLHYLEALYLLPKSQGSAEQRIELNRGLGNMLQKQGRFKEAIAAFNEMQEDALSIQNHKAQMQAYSALLLVYGLDEDYRKLLPLAQEAEKVARGMHYPEAISFALASQAWAYIVTDQINAAVAAGKEALSISSAAVASYEMAFSNAVLGNIGRVTDHFEHAVRLIDRARNLFRQVGARQWDGLMRANLGHIAYVRQDYERSRSFYQDSLRIARDIGEFYGAILSLRRLGKIALKLQQFSVAENYYQQALLYAEKSGNIAFRADIANDLGQMYLRWATIAESPMDVVDVEAYLRQANKWLERAVALCKEASNRHVTLGEALIGFTQLLIEDDKFEDALGVVLEAIEAGETAVSQMLRVRVAKMLCAKAWRTCAIVASFLPVEQIPLQIGAESVTPRDCFTKSVQLFADAKQRGLKEKAETLQVWAMYESDEGHEARSRALLQEADKIYGRLKLPKS